MLRRGFKHVSARFEVCQFQPAQGRNPTTLARHAQVHCRVVRQLRYSLNAAKDSLDLTFFVNGVPVATAELKTDFTQSVRDAIAQYRYDRPPRDPATNRDEPLLQGSRRALVHFAISTDEVWMTTRLEGKATRFLPFNLGNDGGAGNPPNPDGYRTAYLWERVLERQSLLDILANFAHIVTLQTFPFALEAIRTQGSLRTRRFAVIADEAHSSQTGSAASALSKVLSAEQIQEGEEISAEDVLLAEMEDRATHPNISFFAFTATPKAKTLLRFGHRPDPDAPPSETNMPVAFHVYSMQQAIEEGYILDVLEHYTPYRLAFRLAHNGQEYDQAEVDQAAAVKGLMRWVRLHPYNISQKVQIIVEHFRANIQRLLGGHAKAMVVTGSRKEAVRYKLALDAYIRQQGYRDLAALVAFSGEVSDLESGPSPFSEHSMNPGLKGRDIREAFKGDDYQVLIVANKYQTGFDQPLLCAMYVDKRLHRRPARRSLRGAEGAGEDRAARYLNRERPSSTSCAPRWSWWCHQSDLPCSSQRGIASHCRVSGGQGGLAATATHSMSHQSLGAPPR